MSNNTLPLKSLSIEQIESAISSAISSLTNTETKADITLIKESDFNATRSASGKDQFELSVTIQCGKSYTHGLKENEDGTFKF